MASEEYFLSSLDSVRLMPVRRCALERALVFDSGKAAVEAKLDPPVLGQDFNRGADIATVILSARHEYSTISPVTEFPLFVFVAIPRLDGQTLGSRVSSADLEIIGWGELYETRTDAEAHRFKWQWRRGLYVPRESGEMFRSR